MFAITAVFAAILTFMFIALSFNVIKARREHKVLIGDGGHDPLNRAIRAHANFAEYTPLALLLMALLEARGLPHGWLIFFGLMLIVGRVSHAYSLLRGETKSPQSDINERVKFRMIGMVSTFTLLGLEALALLCL